MQDSLENDIDFARNRSMLDDLGVTHLYRNARERRWLLLLIPVLWLAIANIVFVVSRDVYSGQLQVVPGDLSNIPNRTGGLSDVLGLGGGLLASGSLTGGMFAVYVESWTAPWFAEEVLNDKELTKRIFRDEWSDDAQGWKEPQVWLHAVRNRIEELFGARTTPWLPPDAEAMLRYLRDHIEIEKKRGEVMTSITVETRDRELARDILQYGHKHIGEHLATIFQGRADANIKYLLQEMAKISVADYRHALTDELERQEKQKMLAFSNPEFAAQSLGMYVTTKPVKPRNVSVILISLFGSIVLYLVLVIAVARFDRARQQAYAHPDAGYKIKPSLKAK